MDSEVHIRSYTTGRYLHAAGGWTALRYHARRFCNVTEARDWCVRERLVNIEIIILRNSLLSMRVPVDERA